MRRSGGKVLCLFIVLAAIAGNAWAIAPVIRDKPVIQPSQSSQSSQSLIILAKARTERQKCKALNRCRNKYTRCYNKLVRDQKSIDKHKIDCVKPYQKCINKSFSGFDFFFTRWFNPNANCSTF